ncbi:MAG TPA: hypothetical protein VGB18_05340 [Candidatus Thermoplasmatota archaeon]
MQKFKKASATTKGVLTGDADAYVRRFQIQVDQFVEDLERFDEALWVFVHDYKEKLYKFLELFMERDSKNGNGRRNFNELKKSFAKLQNSAASVAKDLERTIGSVKQKKLEK